MSLIVVFLIVLTSFSWAYPDHWAQSPTHRKKKSSLVTQSSKFPRFMRKAERPVLDQAIMCELLASALRGGNSIPGALLTLGEALEEPATSHILISTARSLLMGATWEEAWNNCPDNLMLLEYSLEPAWKEGVSPLPLLMRSAQNHREQRARHAHEAAARLGAKLVAPLGLCFLPAFLFVGVVPVVLSVAYSLFGE